MNINGVSTEDTELGAAAWEAKADKTSSHLAKEIAGWSVGMLLYPAPERDSAPPNLNVLERTTMRWIIAVGIALAIVWHLGGWHVVHRPTPSQLFGCAHTYVNAAGEDTGECD